ncbi:hypothetical protein BN1708_003453 [Verticillium longisporum]|uniref:Uncharacterized protein n=1 Tax=Verticillium longisporum TaxID=100787 RepID=A0A0G4LIK9_VERLO|nr:hypothetical protein BN1708_003453 [Verticillium longisporum]
MADTKKTAPAPAAETKETAGRPQLPDEAVYQKNLKAAEADHKASMDKLEEKAPLLADRGLGAQAERKVDDAGIKGTKILSKKDREEDFFPATKKGKKGKKGAAAAAASPAEGAKFSCPPSVVEDCAAMGIDPPMSAADIPSVTEQVKAKLDHWKADQAAQTQKNIEKAKAKIAALEAEEETEKTNGANGADTSDAVDEVTKDLKETSVEDKA